MTNKPVAVLISDIHYSLNTLQEASISMYAAIDEAVLHNVPLIVAGDLHDSKAHMRAECINEMLEVFKVAAEATKVYLIVGNHDKINEKSVGHSLNFLSDYTTLINNPKKIKDLGLYLVPYFSDPDSLREYLKEVPVGSTLIMHQGINGSDSGEYIIDKSALNKSDLAGVRVISGHYHKRQTLELPNGGQFDYIGNPYSLTFGEAKDPAKGFQVLYADGSLEFRKTSIRRHVIMDMNIQLLKSDASTGSSFEDNDILWVKISGTSEELKGVDKKFVADNLGIIQDFRLELIQDEVVVDKTQSLANLPKDQLLDKLIESLSSTSVDQKDRLKTLWKLLVEN